MEEERYRNLYRRLMAHLVATVNFRNSDYYELWQDPYLADVLPYLKVEQQLASTVIHSVVGTASLACYRRAIECRAGQTTEIARILRNKILADCEEAFKIMDFARSTLFQALTTSSLTE